MEHKTLFSSPRLSTTKGGKNCSWTNSSGPTGSSLQLHILVYGNIRICSLQKASIDRKLGVSVCFLRRRPQNRRSVGLLVQWHRHPWLLLTLFNEPSMSKQVDRETIVSIVMCESSPFTRTKGATNSGWGTSEARANTGLSAWQGFPDAVVFASFLLSSFQDPQWVLDLRQP